MKKVLNLFLCSSRERRVCSLKYEEGFTQLFQGFNAFYRCFVAEPQKGVVVGVHGFCEHSGRYAEFGRFLAENGYTFSMPTTWWR